ncbi:JmjC domain-containing protein [Kaarinaea lacus]
MPDSKDNSILGNVNAAVFLAEYWQKKPLLIRSAMPHYVSPLSADELAGLACNDDVESRIVLEKDGTAPWELRHGPFDDDTFGHLPETHWTLLVQECNKHVPDLALLLDQFNFIPNWRIDDVMVSYAAPGGSVGPHVDQYDVFLLQVMGQRRWQIHSRKSKHLDFLPHTDLRILKQFDAEQEWVLEPGDMLYLPPGIAHYGVALDDCMTFSIGFRAPSHYDLLMHFAENQFSDITDPFLMPRYEDPDLKLNENCGEIAAQSLEKIIDTIQSYSSNADNIKRWFGRFITEPKNDNDALPQEETFISGQLRNLLAQQKYVCRSEYARFSYIKNSDNTTYFYVNGQEHLLAGNAQSFASTICKQRRFDKDTILNFINSPDCEQLVIDFFNNGYLYFETE